MCIVPIIGVGIGMIAINVTDSIPIKSQVEYILRVNSISNINYEDVKSSINIGSIYGVKQDNIKVDTISLQSRLGDVLDIKGYESTMTESDNVVDYSIYEYIKKDCKIQPYDICVGDIGDMTILVVNNGGDDADILDTIIIAVDVKEDESIRCYNYIGIGSTRDEVHNSFYNESMLESGSKNCEIYEDDFDNYIMLLYKDDIVIEYVVGNTLRKYDILNNIN